jgi:hypothetical protein
MWLARCLRAHCIDWDIIGQHFGRYKTSSDAYWIVLDTIRHQTPLGRLGTRELAYSLGTRVQNV